MIFKNHDKNSSGTLEMNEILSAINDLYKALNRPPPSEKEAWDKMKEYDKNKIGQLTCDDFVEIGKDLTGFHGVNS